jgi:succinyl-CoA synthetase alpha subunit
LECSQTTEEAIEVQPRTLDSALRILPHANLVAISVPGAYVKYEAMRALRRGLHLFIFSDNVPLEDEIELKQEALRKRLFCMGPDCGTAYLNGTGLGFFNVVFRGQIGCISASGTGIQAVVSRLATLGEGISHGIGVGSRDLSRDVGGMMTFFALEALVADVNTEVIVLISKPPHPEIMSRLEITLEKIGKPIILCCLGVSGFNKDKVLWVKTLDEAAETAAAILHNRQWTSHEFSDPEGIRARLDRIQVQDISSGQGILGLYTGGTLAHEACLLLEPLIGPVGFNPESGLGNCPHRILDLGDDAYTVGRPHPMIDPQKRIEFILKAGCSRQVGVLLLDFVLGKGSHPNPAEPVVEALKKAILEAQADGRKLFVVASVIGTSMDPQNLSSQVTQLEDAGVEVFDTNAEATRFAALLVKSDLSHLFLKDVK